MANNGEFSRDQQLKEAKIPSFLHIHKAFGLLGFGVLIKGSKALVSPWVPRLVSSQPSYSLKTIRGSLHVGVRY